MNAGRLGIEETMRSIMCSTMLHEADLLARVVKRVVLKGVCQSCVLQLSQDHDDDGLVGFLGFGDLVAKAGDTG